MYKTYYTYIMSSNNNSTLYIGVTDDLGRRVTEHESGNGSVFTAKYHCRKLVYYESFSDINQAIAREKQLKGWKRERKDALIDSVNIQRVDLFSLDSSLRSE
ncbi:MAG: GIY-YIG nuclease family protein [Bacteroidales bacterium]|nr:GIY-YIG nuclease family protein [Bacteroidales bacterium]